MNCDLQCIRQMADGRHLLRCSRCDREVSVADPARVLQAKCGMSRPTPRDGAGTELAGVIKELRQQEKAGCGCAALRAEMNQLGVCGCRRERGRLADALRAKAAKVGLASKAIAAWSAATSGIALRINWADPFPGLIDLAIERAAAIQAESSSHTPQQCPSSTRR